MKNTALLAAIVAAPLAAATLSSHAMPRTDLLGAAAPPAAAQRTVVLSPDTPYVNVTSGDVVRFVAGDQSFTWNFQVAQGYSSFALNRVAPAGMLQHQVTAYVAPSPRYAGARAR